MEKQHTDAEAQAAGLPAIYSPEDVAKHFGWSPRKVREVARKIGACRVLGNRMLLTVNDIAPARGNATRTSEDCFL